MDLYHFDPMITMKKGVGSLHLPLHYLRLVIFLSSAIGHLAVAVPYALICGHEDGLNGHRMYDRMKAIKCHRAELWWDISGEMVANVCFWILTGIKLGFVRGVCTHFTIWIIAGYLFCFFTQASHLQEECFAKEEDLKHLSFAKRQVLSSIDFTPGSEFWSHVSGGLNMQAPHHCFPSVSAAHLRSLYPLFRKICKKHGVQLKETISVSEFLQGFFQLTN